MNFVHPNGLWLLLLGIPIVALHFYRGRVRKRSVPSLALWEEVIREENRKSALRQLRHRLSLLLNLLVLLFLTASAAEPIIPGWNSPEKVWAFVLDTSPRMFVREEDGQSRLEKSRKVVEEWLSVVGEASLYDGTGLVEPATKDRDRIRATLRQMEVRREGDPFKVVDILKKNRPELEVLLFSDRGAAGSVSLGSPRENRGWMSGSWQIPPGALYPTLTLNTHRFGGRAQKETLTLRWNGSPFGEEEVILDESLLFQLALDPETYPEISFDLGGVLEVEFKEKDSFPLDDVATFVFPATAPLPLLLFHPDAPDSRLWKALEGLAEAGLVAEPIAVPIEKFSDVTSAMREGIVAIFDRCAPPKPLTRGAFLFFGGGEGWLPVEVGSEKEFPEITDWNSEGGLLRGIDLTDFAVRRSRILKGGRMLISSSEGVVAVVKQQGGFSAVVFGFPLSLSESDLTLRAAFPLFLRQWVEWIRLGGANRSFPRQGIWSDPITPTAPLWIEEGKLQVTERDAKQEIPVEKGRLLAPCISSAPGPVQVRAAEREEWIGVNLFRPDWSDLREEGSASPPKPIRPWYRDLPLPFLGAGLALLFLLLEWFLFHRGWI